MSYTRVIPRDLFNEAKLLKCLGQLALIAHDGVDSARTAFPRSVAIEHDGEAFEIEQDQDSGELYCSTIRVVIGPRKQEIRLVSAYNSRSPFPLLASCGDSDQVDVFNADGTLSESFLRLVAGAELLSCCGARG